MKISVVTDEVSSDFETALEIIRAWGVRNVELRGIGDERFPDCCRRCGVSSGCAGWSLR